MIAWEYNPFWMQFVWDSEKEQWDMAQKVMSLLPAAENPNIRIKINAYYAPMPSYLVTLDYDADVADVSIMMDGKSISSEQFMGIIGCGISVTQHTLQNDMITFYYIPIKDGSGGDEFHTCTATIAPKNGPVLFASD